MDQKVIDKLPAFLKRSYTTLVDVHNRKGLLKALKSIPEDQRTYYKIGWLPGAISSAL